MSLPPYIFQNKVGGWLFLNGNIPDPRDLVTMFKAQILNPCHSDPEIDEDRGVVLVTAAFKSGHEYHDRHLILDFEQIGIDAGWQDGLPTKVRNLAVWNKFKQWQDSEKWLYQRYTEKQEAVQAIKADYVEKLRRYVQRVTSLLHILTGKYENLGLYELYHLDSWKALPAHILPEEDALAVKVDKALGDLYASRVDRGKAQEIRHIIDHLVFKDREVMAACRAIEDHFKYASGLEKSELYLVQKQELWQALQRAATVFMYGGRVFVLNNRLRFYDLDRAILAAVERGTNVFGISAGSVIQTDLFSIAEPGGTGGHQIPADTGLGLITNLRVFPHAYDYYHYMRDGQRNDLSFFALRHPGCITAGLNQKSVLLREQYRNTKDGKTYLRYTSVGTQPVLVFGPRGRRYEMQSGDQILLPGTRRYDGTPRLSRLAEADPHETGVEMDPSQKVA